MVNGEKKYYFAVVCYLRVSEDVNEIHSFFLFLWGQEEWDEIGKEGRRIEERKGKELNIKGQKKTKRMQGRGKQVDWEEERYSTKAQVADCRWIRSHLRLSPHRAVRLQACMFCCRATHSSSQTAGSIDAFMWSTAQSRATAHCVYVCACVCECVCVRVWNPGFSPHGTCTNTLPIFPLSFTFKGSTRSAVNHSLHQSRPFIPSLFIDQGWFKRTYVMWLEFLPWLILIL